MTKRYDEYKDSGVEWLGEIPSHWNIVTLKNNFKSGIEGIRMGPFGSAIKSSEIVDFGIKIYGQGNAIRNDFQFNDKYITFDKFEKGFQQYELKPNDFIATTMGTTGKFSIVPENIEKGIIDSHLIRIRFNNNVIPKYVNIVLNNLLDVKRQIHFEGKGSIMHGLNSKIIKNLYFPIPNKSEQEFIANYLDNKTSKIDSAVEELTKQKDLLIELKKSTIHQAVTKGLDLTVPMKDSGVEWIGEVPSKWDIKNAKDFYCFSMGNTILKEDLSEAGIPVYSATAEDKFFGFVEKANLLLKKDDLVISARGTIGFAKIVNREATSTQTTIAARKKSNINSKFIYYYLHGLQNEIFKFDKTAVPQYTVESAKTIKVCVPKKIEQNDIVSYLDKKTGQIDQSIEVIDNQIAKMKEYKKTLINDVVTGKIKVV